MTQGCCVFSNVFSLLQTKKTPNPLVPCYKERKKKVKENLLKQSPDENGKFITDNDREAKRTRTVKLGKGIFGTLKKPKFPQKSQKSKESHTNQRDVFVVLFLKQDFILNDFWICYK